MKNIFKGEVIKKDVRVKGAWDRILSRARARAIRNIIFFNK